MGRPVSCFTRPLEPLYERNCSKLRDAGMLSPEGRRLLAQAEAVEVANREMAEVKARLEARLRQIDEDAEQARRQLQ